SQGRALLTGGVLLAHLLAGWALLQVDAVRLAVQQVVPTLMVDMIAPPEPEKPVAQPPKAKALPTPAPPPLIAAAPTPSPTPTPPVFVAPIPVPAPPTPLVSAPVPPAPPVQAAPAPAALKQVPPSAVRYLVMPKLHFPLLSQRAKESGVVVLRIVVDAEGRLKSASVQQSSGFARLDEQAKQDIRSARFVPQTEDGKPVEWETLAPLAYDR
ncbi:MAG TPA: energy transducer TonB, partial [Burkholderiaceae bacterium]